MALPSHWRCRVARHTCDTVSSTLLLWAPARSWCCDDKARPWALPLHLCLFRRSQVLPASVTASPEGPRTAGLPLARHEHIQGVSTATWGQILTARRGFTGTQTAPQVARNEEDGPIDNRSVSDQEDANPLLVTSQLPEPSVEGRTASERPAQMHQCFYPVMNEVIFHAEQSHE
ncbi:hypothetical protein NDU88_001863 [Pleurodeles waltl]|uniref:Uncharacterized protein n=1 Tax=Pleurodeles waltl TaxID=8319 RepID=A0AAV7RE14_PLEWA|nr:hypothetical protein NDU88_001863 [Pleurodeles waltl]